MKSCIQAKRRPENLGLGSEPETVAHKELWGGAHFEDIFNSVAKKLSKEKDAAGGERRVGKAVEKSKKAKKKPNTPNTLCWVCLVFGCAPPRSLPGCESQSIDHSNQTTAHRNHPQSPCSRYAMSFRCP